MRRSRRGCGDWTYYAGMATCPHGYELLPDGEIRALTVHRWRSHRAAIGESTDMITPDDVSHPEQDK
jgi:hypothetical protein